MADEYDAPGNADNGPGGKRRRRRRRRRGGRGGDEGGPPVHVQQQQQPHREREHRDREPQQRRARTPDFGDDLLVAEGDDTGRRGRRPSVEIQGPQVQMPSSGRNPYRKRSTRARRQAPSSAAARRRKLSRGQLDDIGSWLSRMQESLVGAIYRGLGGQPGRIGGGDRMIQLTVRALAQGNRIGGVVKQLQERERKAMAALLQAGGVAHADDLHRELSLSFGGHEREWSRAMLSLANRGLVFASQEQDNQFFYLVPEPLIDGLLEELGDELTLPTFSHPDVKVLESRPFCPPLEFSITTFATYIDQRNPRTEGRHRLIPRPLALGALGVSSVAFVVAAWWINPLCGWLSPVALRGEYLAMNRDVMEEWLQLEAEDQRDLLFRALEKRFQHGEWILWAVHAATQIKADGKGPTGALAAFGAQTNAQGGSWVAERPLVGLYRRWRRGEDWRERFTRGNWAPTRTSERESWSFAPLVRCGLLEMGQWGQEKFYRLTPRGRQLLEPAEDDGFRQFYLTPSFEIMAPAGLAPILLFRIGELADLIGCDRANTYKITESSIERAIERGWRRDDVLQFLRDNSQIGLPDNVESTLKGWIGHRGDVEFHDLMLMTVHRSQIRRLESHKRIKPYLLHRFAPGMYGVDRRRKEELAAILADTGFAPSKEVRNYPGDPTQATARAHLQKLVAEAREQAIDPAGKAAQTIAPELLCAVPGTRTAASAPEPDLPPLVNATEARQVLDKAMSKDHDVEMVYIAKTGERLALTVQPERLAFRDAVPVLVGLDRESGENRTFLLDKIERIRVLAEG